jgi:hypothetical protein
MIPGIGVWRTIRLQARRAAAWPFRVAAARAALRPLANMDRRELADIGLNPSDLRDASALPLDRDPTELLARRVRERRGPVAAAPPHGTETGPTKIRTASRDETSHRPARVPGRREPLSPAN